jgi:hypothetical protein
LEALQKWRKDIKVGYVGANEINFNSKIEDNWVFVIEIEKELKG